MGTLFGKKIIIRLIWICCGAKYPPKSKISILILILQVIVNWSDMRKCQCANTELRNFESISSSSNEYIMVSSVILRGNLLI